MVAIAHLRPETYDVFLAYRSTDFLAVELLANKLRAAGLQPFFDRWHLVPGRPWQEGLESALEASLTCAVFLGPKGLGPWQNEEMRVGLDQRVRKEDFRVIPVLLPGAPEPEQKRFPSFLGRLTWVRFTSLDDEEALYRLIAGIRGLPAGSPVISATALSPSRPSDSESAHLSALLEIHRERRRELEKQAALQGPDAPPHIVIELEELHERIGELEGCGNEL